MITHFSDFPFIPALTLSSPAASGDSSLLWITNIYGNIFGAKYMQVWWQSRWHLSWSLSPTSTLSFWLLCLTWRPVLIVFSLQFSTPPVFCCCILSSSKYRKIILKTLVWLACSHPRMKTAFVAGLQAVYRQVTQWDHSKSPVMINVQKLSLRLSVCDWPYLCSTICCLIILTYSKLSTQQMSYTRM